MWWSIVLSGVVAAIITLIVTYIMQVRRDRKEYKMEIFKNVVAYRTDLTASSSATGNLQIALNQIFVAFNRDKIVIQAFEALRKDVQYKVGPQDNEKIVSDILALIKSMADNLKIDYSFSNDDLFTKPLTLGPQNKNA